LSISSTCMTLEHMQRMQSILRLNESHCATCCLSENPCRLFANPLAEIACGPLCACFESTALDCSWSYAQWSDPVKKIAIGVGVTKFDNVQYPWPFVSPFRHPGSFHGRQWSVQRSHAHISVSKSFWTLPATKRFAAPGRSVDSNGRSSQWWCSVGTCWRVWQAIPRSI